MSTVQTRQRATVVAEVHRPAGPAAWHVSRSEETAVVMDDLLREMIDPAPPPRDVPRRRRLWATVAVVGLAAAGATSLTTSAVFTDRERSDAGITTGSIDLEVGSFTLPVPVGGMLPGQTVATPVQLTNTGSLALRYAVGYDAVAADAPDPPETGEPVGPDDPAAVAGTGDLRDVLSLGVFSVTGPDACTADLGDDLDASLGHVSGLATGTGPRPLVGDPAPGAQDGDRMLPAVEDSGEWLCVTVSMDPAAGNEYQSTAVDIALTFDSEQTINNG